MDECVCVCVYWNCSSVSHSLFLEVLLPELTSSSPAFTCLPPLLTHLLISSSINPSIALFPLWSTFESLMLNINQSICYEQVISGFPLQYTSCSSCCLNRIISIRYPPTNIFLFTHLTRLTNQKWRCVFVPHERLLTRQTHVVFECVCRL